jgi:uncharacterized membrane protein
MSTISHHEPVYPIRNVPLTRPFIWLGEAWQDMLHHRASSLAYGFIVSAMGMVILAYERHPLFVAAAIAAFMVMGPILAAGLCELSRCSDLNNKSDFDSSLKTLRRNRKNLFGVIEKLLIICVVWFIASFLIIHYTLASPIPSLAQTVWGDVLYSLSTAQLTYYIFAVSMLAGVIYACSVVTIPMIIEHHVDADTAITTSLRVFVKDLPVVLVWAILITLLTVIGFATFLVGMVVIFPLLGHATWYAYKDLVKQ